MGVREHRGLPKVAGPAANPRHYNGSLNDVGARIMGHRDGKWGQALIVMTGSNSTYPRFSVFEVYGLQP